MVSLNNLVDHNFAQIHRLDSIDRHLLVHIIVCDTSKRACLTMTSIQEKHSDINIFHLISNFLPVVFDFQFSMEIKHDGSSFNFRALSVDLCNHVIHLFSVTRNHADIKTLCRH